VERYAKSVRLQDDCLGGYGSNDYLNSGGLGGQYDPVTDAWTATPTGSNVPAARSYHTAIWTGSKMIVWGGGGSNSYLKTGGRYTPP